MTNNDKVPEGRVWLCRYPPNIWIWVSLDRPRQLGNMWAFDEGTATDAVGADDSDKAVPEAAWWMKHLLGEAIPLENEARLITTHEQEYQCPVCKKWQTRASIFCDRCKSGLAFAKSRCRVIETINLEESK